MEQRENLLDILKVLFQWKKNIFISCIGVGLLATLIALLLPNYYQSSTLFYAASMDQVKPGHIFGTTNSETDFYGNSHDNDRLLTIAESNEVATYLIDKFDLYTHYDIDKSNDKAAYKVREKFFKYYNVLKTKRDAIRLSMEDTDRVQAAAIVNAARDKVDELYIKVIQEKLKRIEQSLERNISEKEKKLAQISDSLSIIKNNYHIYDSENQGKVFAEQMLATESKAIRETTKLVAFKKISTFPKDSIAILDAIVSGYNKELELLKEKQKLYNKGLSKVKIYEQEQKELSNRLSFQKFQFNQLITAQETPFSGINLIEAGEIPIIKSRPKRSILIISAVLISFLFNVIGILLFDAYKDVNWREIIRA